MISVRQGLLLTALCLLAASLFLLVVFGPASYGQLQALSKVTYHEGSYHHLSLALTPTRHDILRGSLLLVAGLSAGMLAGLGRAQYLQQQGQQLRHEFRQAAHELRLQLRHTTRGQRTVGGSFLGLLLLVRLWYLVEYPISTDEAASFDYFIREGPVAIGSFYPIPNNHPFFNFLCWPLSLVSQDMRVVMRLPTLLAATAGTLLAYVLLTRQVGFRAATLGLGFFSFSPLALYYAVAGRGYFLQLMLLLAAFFAALALWRATLYPRLAWVIFVVASILGLYTIPTFAYPLAALGAALLLGFASRRRWTDIGLLLLHGAAIAAAAVLLYAPVIAVSGLPRLLGNRYIARLTAEKFWRLYAGYLHTLADTLAGAPNLGLAAGAVLLLAVPLLIWRHRSLRPLLLQMALLLLVPVGLMAVQQVLIPERVALFMACFACLLLGVAGAALLRRTRLPGFWQMLVGLVGLAGYAGFVQTCQLDSLRAEQARAQQLESTYQWLTEWGAQRVFLASPYHELFLHHYALLANRPLLLHTTRDSTLTYDFVVLERGGTAPPAWTGPPHYTPVYEDALGVVYGRAAPSPDSP